MNTNYKVIFVGQGMYPIYDCDPELEVDWEACSICVGQTQDCYLAMLFAEDVHERKTWNDYEKPKAPVDSAACYVDPSYLRVEFSPNYVIIVDDNKSLVAAGKAAYFKSIEWIEQVSNPEQLKLLKEKRLALLEEAAIEATWDNFETAKDLRQQAKLINFMLGEHSIPL